MLRSDLVAAVACLDLTSLGEDDTKEKIADLCRRARAAGVAAVCVLPSFVALARRELADSRVRVATVVDFPAGAGGREEKIAQARDAAEAGADEIDAVFDWNGYLRGKGDRAAGEIEGVRKAIPDRTLKVILETGQLPVDRIGEAAGSVLAAGADFVKTSTGTLSPGATPEAAREIARAIARFRAETGLARGLKVSGGIRRAEEASVYLRIVEEELGPDALSPSRFRIGASSLLDELLTRLAPPHPRPSATPSPAGEGDGG